MDQHPGDLQSPQDFEGEVFLVFADPGISIIK